jgi:hypothetical protein
VKILNKLWRLWDPIELEWAWYFNLALFIFSCFYNLRNQRCPLHYFVRNVKYLNWNEGNMWVFTTCLAIKANVRVVVKATNWSSLGCNTFEWCVVGIEGMSFCFLGPLWFRRIEKHMNRKKGIECYGAPAIQHELETHELVVELVWLHRRKKTWEFSVEIECMV